MKVFSKGILVDTSFLLEAFQSPGSLFWLEERYPHLPLYIPESVLNELHHISKKRLKSKYRRANLILKYIGESGRFKVVKSLSKNADEDIILLARSKLFIVATGDRNIREKLSEEGVKIIYLKNNYPHII